MITTATFNKDTKVILLSLKHFQGEFKINSSIINSALNTTSIVVVEEQTYQVKILLSDGNSKMGNSSSADGKGKKEVKNLPKTQDQQQAMATSCKKSQGQNRISQETPSNIKKEKGVENDTKGDGKILTVTELYLKLEFTAMDVNGDGMITTEGFVKLLQFLGYGGDDGRAQHLLKEVNKDDYNTITLDEYFEAMNKHPDVLKMTSGLRNLFLSFDTNSDGFAYKSDIIAGFEHMGIDVDDSMKEEIEKMDTNKDGRVSYGDFVRAQLIKKGFIKVTKK